jgi:hypothetical protein
MNRIGLAVTVGALATSAAPATAATVTLTDGGFGPHAVKLAGTDPGGIPRWSVPFESSVHVTGKVLDDTSAPAQQGVSLAMFAVPFGQQASGGGSASTAGDGTFSDEETIVRGTTVFAGLPAAPGYNIAADATSNSIDFYTVPHVQLIKGTNFVTRIFYGTIGTLDGTQGKLYLERKSGRTWKVVRTGRADRGGNYTIHYGRAPHGSYRLYFHSSNPAVTLDGVSNTVKI